MPQGTYLAVVSGGGERYTRAASLSVGPDGTLNTAGGVAVAGEDGKPIKLVGDTTNVRIDDSGQVHQGDQVAGRVKLVSFPTPASLAHESGSLLAATGQVGDAVRVRPGSSDIGGLRSRIPASSAR